MPKATGTEYCALALKKYFLGIFQGFSRTSKRLIMNRNLM
jgi:hypothetical protein